VQLSGQSTEEHKEAEFGGLEYGEEIQSKRDAKKFCGEEAHGFRSRRVKPA
jgi:hypothetical protein